jgi:cell division protein DivIC
MSRRGKRLREFEKNNRTFNISEAREKRAQKYSYLETKRNEENVAIEETRTAERKKKKSKIVNMKRFVASVIILILIASVGMSAINIVQLTIQKKELQVKNAELIKLKEDLTSEMDFINSAEYIEQQARKDLRMIKENELLFIVDDEEDKE